MRRAFTVVELLVVIAMVAVVVGLLVPALARPFDPPRRTQGGAVL